MAVSSLQHLGRCVVKDILASSRGKSVTRTPIVQSVRFRKPWWVPVAKSKEFYVRRPTPIVPEEYSEVIARYRQYKAEVDSVRKFLKGFIVTSELSEPKKVADTTDDFEWMKKQVEEWNSRLVVLREEETLTLKREREQMINTIIENEKVARDLALKKALEELEIKKAEVGTFITREKLDDAIEGLLDSYSDYNFAITKSGEILPGEYPNKQVKPSQDQANTSSSN